MKNMFGPSLRRYSVDRHPEELLDSWNEHMYSTNSVVLPSPSWGQIDPAVKMVASFFIFFCGGSGRICRAVEAVLLIYFALPWNHGHTYKKKVSTRQMRANSASRQALKNNFFLIKLPWHFVLFVSFESYSSITHSLFHIPANKAAHLCATPHILHSLLPMRSLNMRLVSLHNVCCPTFRRRRPAFGQCRLTDRTYLYFPFFY